MSCASGTKHTVVLSEDGVVFSFGENVNGQLGFGHFLDASLPSRVPNLPRIEQVACGAFHTVCVDYDGFVWSFGINNSGQLGIGDALKECESPQKIQNIPPVLSVHCGAYHTMIITDDSNLWSCGGNADGQLCLKNRENQCTFTQTSFSNISKVSLGGFHSLFQNKNGEIYLFNLFVVEIIVVF